MPAGIYLTRGHDPVEVVGGQLGVGRCRDLTEGGGRETRMLDLVPVWIRILAATRGRAPSPPRARPQIVTRCVPARRAGRQQTGGAEPGSVEPR